MKHYLLFAAALLAGVLAGCVRQGKKPLDAKAQEQQVVATLQQQHHLTAVLLP